jgi:hypothetical protein
VNPLALDVCQEIGALLLQDDVTLVVLDEEPLVWEVEHLYVYPLDVNTYSIETRGGPDDTGTARQDCSLRAVYVTRSKDEARQKRDPVLASDLDTIRGQFVAILWQNPRLPSRPLRSR